MGISSLGNLSLSTLTSVTKSSTSPTLAASAISAAIAQAPSKLHLISPAPDVSTLKGGAAFDPGLTWTSVGQEKNGSAAAVIAALTPGKPTTPEAAGDEIAKWIINMLRSQGYLDLPNVDLSALSDTIKRVVRDICEHWKPGDDLGGQLRAAVGFALWGAGVSPDELQAAGDDIASLMREGLSPIDTAQEMWSVDQAWTNVPVAAGHLPNGPQAYVPLNKSGLDSANPFGLHWTDGVRTNLPTHDVNIDEPNADDLVLDDSIGIKPPSNGFPWHFAPAVLAGQGIADLVDQLLPRGILSDAQRSALQQTIERVVRDVCEKCKPGDDLIGNIRAGVAFALWGAGVDPGWTPAFRSAPIADDVARILTQHFPGDGTAALAAMGDYFATHDASDLLATPYAGDFPFGKGANGI